MTLTSGIQAPSFTLPDDNNQLTSLQNYQGKKIILYFYPKDNTPGCTLETCAFNHHLTNLNHYNTVVLGVSRDSVASHQKFKSKYGIDFPLLADETGSTCHAYGVIVEKSNFGKKYLGIERTTFLIDESGIIRKIWRKVKVKGHVEEILSQVQEPL